MSIVKVTNLKKSYGSHVVLKNLNFQVEKNDFFVITGKSGCGKSTLLNIIGMLDKADEGSVYLFDEQIPSPFSRKSEKLLKDKIGYLFQDFALLENETVKYNLSIVINKKSKDKEYLIKEALEKVGLSGYENKKIYECSGGEQQRVAIARLLIKPCELILADEPTGSLDFMTKNDIINILLQLRENNKTIIIVTHDLDLIKYATKTLELNKVE